MPPLNHLQNAHSGLAAPGPRSYVAIPTSMIADFFHRANKNRPSRCPLTAAWLATTTFIPQSWGKETTWWVAGLGAIERVCLTNVEKRSMDGGRMKTEVQQALNDIRPMLQADGGDVELVEVTDDGVVRVRLQGACHGCPMSQMTVKNGIERLLKEKVAGVTEVESV